MKTSCGIVRIQDIDLGVDLGIPEIDGRNKETGEGSWSSDSRDVASVNDFPGVDDVEVDRDRETGGDPGASLVRCE